MKRYVWLACALVAAVNTGCVERHFLVTTEVPGVGGDAGAKLYVNGGEVGPTPADVYFTYYGTYHLTLLKDGYEILQVDQCIPAPWYEWPIIDFFTENVWPFKVRDVRGFNYVLQPKALVRPEDVLLRGNALRDRGQTVVPLPDTAPPPPKPGPPPAPPPGPPPTVSPTPAGLPGR